MIPSRHRQASENERLKLEFEVVFAGFCTKQFRKRPKKTLKMSFMSCVYTKFITVLKTTADGLFSHYKNKMMKLNRANGAMRLREKKSSKFNVSIQSMSAPSETINPFFWHFFLYC